MILAMNKERISSRNRTMSRQQGLHVPEKGKTFSGEEREENVAWNKETYNLLKQAEKGVQYENSKKNTNTY